MQITFGMYLFGVRRRAIAAVDGLDGVRHVRLVVTRVEVDAVPAAGEDDLRAHTVGAVVSRESGCGPVRLRARVVEADIVDGSVRKIGRVMGRTRGILGNHPEVIRERNDGQYWCVATTVRQVVHAHEGDRNGRVRLKKAESESSVSWTPHNMCGGTLLLLRW